MRAMDSPYCDIIGHPTGRLLNKRAPCAQLDRLDLSDVCCQLAKELGLKVAISTDAHSVANLDLMRFGIDQGRRGWLEPDDVLNTRSWPELQQLLRRA